MNEENPEGLVGEPLSTSRCELVPVTEEVARQIVARDVRNLHPADGWPHPGTFVAASHVLSGAKATMWRITVKGQTIGDCGTHGPPGASGEIEIGYGLAASFRGAGYGTEAVTALTAWLAHHPEISRVIAHTTPDNIASQRVLEKTGFRSVAASPTDLTYVFDVTTPV